MGHITDEVLILGTVNLLMFPILVFILKRIIGKMLDNFDEKRKDARTKQEQFNAKSESEQAAIRKGIRSLLRSELIHEHRKFFPKGYITYESKEYIQHTYDAYHSLGGNDVGTSLYNDLINLPVREEGCRD